MKIKDCILYFLGSHPVIHGIESLKIQDLHCIIDLVDKNWFEE